MCWEAFMVGKLVMNEMYHLTTIGFVVFRYMTLVQLNQESVRIFPWDQVLMFFSLLALGHQ